MLADSIASLGLLIAFYYGMTGFTAPVFYRHTLTKSVRHFFMRGVIPFLGGLILLAAFLQAAHDYWLVGPNADSTTSWKMPFPPHWEIGGIFLTGIGALAAGGGADDHHLDRDAAVLPRRDAAQAHRRADGRLRRAGGAARVSGARGTLDTSSGAARLQW